MDRSNRRKASPSDRDEISLATYRRLHPQLYVQIRRLGVPDVDVEDLIQETFLSAQKGLDSGSFEGRSSLDTWIVSIAKGVSLKYHRRLRTAKRKAILVPLRDQSEPGERHEVPMPTSAEPSPQTTASDREEVAHALRALHGLPESFREPLVLRTPRPDPAPPRRERHPKTGHP